jgi:lysophospholipase L1-like esterase
MKILVAVPVTVVLLVVLAVGALLRTLRRLPGAAPDSPAAVAAGDVEPDRPVVVVLGASTVRGNVSYPIVAALRHRLPGYHLVNAGENGTTVRQAVDRLPDVIACAPAVVIVLIGGNDLLAIIHSPLARHNPQLVGERSPSTLDDFAVDLRTLVDRLAAGTTARIGLCSLPVAGERPDSAVNAAIDRMNEVIRAVARQAGVGYLPVNGRVRQLLPTGPGATGRDVSQRPVVVLGAAVLRLGLGLPLSWIARLNGYRLFTDGIHLTGRSGEVVADVMAEFVLPAGPRPPGYGR